MRHESPDLEAFPTAAVISSGVGKTLLAGGRVAPGAERVAALVVAGLHYGGQVGSVVSVLGVVAGPGWPLVPPHLVVVGVDRGLVARDHSAVQGRELGREVRWRCGGLED